MESPLASTIKGLLLRPGVTIRAYLDGKRRNMYRPFRFYLLSLTFFLIVFYHSEGWKELQDSLLADRQFPGQQEMMSQFMQYMNDFMKWLTFLQVPIAAIAAWLFYHGSKYSYWEYFVAALYINGFSLLVMAAATSIIILIPETVMAVGIFNNVFLLVYFAWAFADVMEQKKWYLYLKAGLLYITNFVLYSISIIVISLITMYFVFGSMQ